MKLEPFDLIEPKSDKTIALTVLYTDADSVYTVNGDDLDKELLAVLDQLKATEPYSFEFWAMVDRLDDYVIAIDYEPDEDNFWNSIDDYFKIS